MNILIINGSPRKKSLISHMLGIMQEEAASKGDEVQTVYTNDLNIKPCIGCMAVHHISVQNIPQIWLYQ